MKKFSIFVFIGICFLTACRSNTSQKEQVITPDQTTDSSAMSGGENNDQMTRTPDSSDTQRGNGGIQTDSPGR